MRKTVYKLFMVWNFDKEEDWLNEMALQGWVLDGVGLFTYHFISSEPGEFSVRLEMRGLDERYLDFMAETGAEYIGRVVQWIYFRKKTAAGTFNIFSDIDSKIAHLRRIGKMLFVVGMANLFIGLAGIHMIGWLNLLCSTLLMYALGRIQGKKEALEKERTLHE